MSKSRLYLVGILVSLAGCAGGDPSGSNDEGAAAASSPLATIELGPGRRLEFHGDGNAVMVAELHPIGEADTLSAADKALSAPDLYRKFAPASPIPAALYGTALPSDGAAASSAEARNLAGGGAPAARTADGVERATGALTLNAGDGCNPPERNVVFADCRSNWYGGYWAYAVPTWYLDSRVEALHGSLDEKVTSVYGGGTFVNQFHVPQGTVENLSYPRARVCKTILGYTVSCSDVQAQRRVDIINASATTFNVDVVFFNN